MKADKNILFFVSKRISSCQTNAAKKKMKENRLRRDEDRRNRQEIGCPLFLLCWILSPDKETAAQIS